MLTVDDHHISLAHPLLPQHARKHLHLIQQLPVGVFLCGVRHWRLPDNGDIVAETIVDVAVHTVVGGGDLAVREPRPMVMLHATRQSLGAAIKNARGFAVPVEPVRVARPEGVGIAERVFERGCLGMWRHVRSVG